MNSSSAPRREALRVALQAALIAIAAIAIEVFVFNFRFFESRSWSPVEPASSVELAAGDAASDGSTQVRPALEFLFDDGAGINDLVLSGLVDGATSFSIYVRDEGNELYYLAGTQVFEGGEAYVRLHPGGKVSAVRLEVEGAAADTALPDVAVRFNVPVPLSFGIFRCALVLGLLLVVYLAGCCGPLLRTSLRRRHVAIIAAVGVVAVCALTYRFHTPLALQPYNEHQYFELSQALAQGHVYLDAVPSRELVSLSNPYDTALRNSLGIDYLWDHAYFEGHYYVYFGILPALLFHLPWYLLTGGELPNWVVVMIMSAVFAAGVAFCLEAVFLHESKRPSVAVFFGLYAAAMFCSYIVNACCGPDMYCTPIVTALACAAWGITFWLRATTPREAGQGQEGVRLGWGMAGSALMALITLARPQLLLLCVLGVPLIIPALRREPTPGRAASRLAIVLVPFVLAFAVAGAYNYARFGSLLDFGANYNLTNNDMTVRGWNVDRTVEGLLSYLFQFPRLTVSPLSIEAATPLIQYFGVSVTGMLPGGILLVVPALLTIPLWLARPRSGNGSTRGMGILLVLVAVVIAAFDANGAGVLTRYYLDFGFIFALALFFAAAHAWDEGLYLAPSEKLGSAELRLRATDRLVWLAALAVTCLMSIVWLCVKTGM